MDRTTQWAPRGSFVAPRGLKLLQAFVANPRQVASIIASSPALQGELSKLACLHTAKSVVELGPGTGETTQAILEAIPEDAVLFSIEIVPELVAEVQRIADPRLMVEHGDALEVTSLVSRREFPAPDVVVSGIPFSHLSPDEGQRLIEAIHSLLSPGGTFVAYQFRDRVCELAREYFGSPRSTFVPWNIPPLELYEWTRA